MIHWDKQTKSGKCNRYEGEKEWPEERRKDSLTEEEKEELYIKESIFQGAFSYVLNDRFIKIAKFSL